LKRSSAEMSPFRRSNSMLSTRRAKSSGSQGRILDLGAIDRKLGRTILYNTGDEPGELSLETVESPSWVEGDEERYARLRGASLYLVSPDVRSGYSEPALVDDETLEGVSLAGGPRCNNFVNLGSTGSGGVDMSAEFDLLPGVVLSGMISRTDLDAKFTAARLATGGGRLGSARYPKEARSGMDIGICGGVAFEGVETDEWGEWGSKGGVEWK
jgi:hypothetical protein